MSYLTKFVTNLTTSKKKLSAELDEALAIATELAEELDRTKAALNKTAKKAAISKRTVKLAAPKRKTK